MEATGGRREESLSRSDYFPILSLPSEVIVMIYDYIGPIERRAMRTMHPLLAEMELNSKYSKEEDFEILLNHDGMVALRYPDYGAPLSFYLNEDETYDGLHMILTQDEFSEEAAVLGVTLKIADLWVEPSFEDYIPSINAAMLNAIGNLRANHIRIEEKEFKCELEIAEILKNKGGVCFRNCVTPTGILKWIYDKFLENDLIHESISMSDCTFEQIQELLEPFGEVSSELNFIPNNNDLEITANVEACPSGVLITIDNTRHDVIVAVSYCDSIIYTNFNYRTRNLASKFE